MTNRRRAIELTEDEQRALMAEARILQVASINADGRPHLVPMWYEVDDEGLMVFTTYGTSQKVVNLERDPRVTVLLEAGDTYDELRGVSMDARAEVVRDPQVTARTLALVGARYSGRPRPPLPAAPSPEADLPPAAFKRVTVRIHPERVRSWDHGKLG
ncbi:MAG: TIGR03618 family F420-dependent PPOX class oxidoreductase [Dehalococcoidia bacterium]|nr:TIGR03618 family F420-dependent PPOX class oxidoreductase [Dehalococcoidia bacterium]